MSLWITYSTKPGSSAGYPYDHEPTTFYNIAIFDDELSVGEAHAAATQIEAKVAALLYPDGRVISHLEPRSAEHHMEPWESH